MTDHFLSDRNLEAALLRRAPRGPDPALLTDIVAAVTDVPQRRGWRRSTTIVRSIPRLRVGWIAVLIALLLLAAALVAGGAGRGLLDARLVAPGPTGSPTPPASSFASTPQPSFGIVRGWSCPADDVQVVTGAAALQVEPWSSRLPAIGSHRAIILGQGSVPVPPAGADLRSPASVVWAVDGSESTPRPVAVIASGGNDEALFGASADGSLMLLRVGNMSPSGASPECADLYLVPTDGSPAVRLTHAVAGEWVPAAALSPVGDQIAYQVETIGSTRSSVVVRDQSTGTVSSYDACPTTAYNSAIAFSPSGERLVMACGDRLVIIDPHSTAPATTVGFNGATVATWTWAASGTDLTVAVTDPAASSGGLSFRTVDPTTGAWSRSGSAQDDRIVWVDGDIRDTFSADGSQLVAYGGKRGLTTGQEFVEVEYLVNPSSGSVRLALGESQPMMSWIDGSGLLFMDLTIGSRGQLARRDPDGSIRDRSPLPEQVRAVRVIP